MAIITLLTDFGTEDEFVGVLKGVILHIDPAATLVDISHHILPQGVDQAGDMLKAAFPWFPKGTIHLAVVDPGVGSDRAILATRCAGHTFIAPDNGLLTAVWEYKHPKTIVRVENSNLYLQPVSRTFHGRDIFAPVAAHLSSGMDINKLGPEIELSQVIQLHLAKPRWDSDEQIVGQVVEVDHFGNLITNIDTRWLDRLSRHHEGRMIAIRIGKYRIEGLSSNYAQPSKNRLIAIIGSRNQLEIAVNGGKAAELFQTAKGMVVRVTI